MRVTPLFPFCSQEALRDALHASFSFSGCQKFREEVGTSLFLLHPVLTTKKKPRRKSIRLLSHSSHNKLMSISSKLNRTNKRCSHRTDCMKQYLITLKGKGVIKTKELTHGKLCGSEETITSRRSRRFRGKNTVRFYKRTHYMYCRNEYTWIRDAAEHRTWRKEQQA